MTVVGNIFLFFTVIAAFALNAAVYKPPPRGDAAVGYFWGILLISVLFLACMIVVSAVIGFKGGFQWVSSQKLPRFLLVAAGLFVAIFTMAISALFRHEKGPVSLLLRILSSFVPFIVPLLLIAASFILLNKNLFANLPSSIYTIPLIVAAGIGLSGTAAAAYDWAAQANRNNHAKIKGIMEDQENNHRRMLAEIDSCDVTKNMVFILVMTDSNQDTDVKERAVAKVKTNPQWQQELINRLRSDWAPEAFTFLASNKVDDPSVFPGAIKEGIIRQARLIREEIKRSSYFYEDQFSWQVQRVLRTADRFTNSRQNFLPEIKQLRLALNKSEIKEAPFACIQLLDEWMKRNQPVNQAGYCKQ